jgi:glycosyltransferase involved in cell wall biosynthesis
VFHLHGPYFPATMGWFQRFLASRMQNFVDAEVCITGGMREMVLRLGWGRPDTTWTVHNAVDCSLFRNLPSPQEARRVLGLPEDALILGMVCRLAWYKGCQDAVRVLARLSLRWHLVFFGDGPMRAYLVDLARQEGVLDRVHFAGMLEDLRIPYAAMDAALFLSRLEPFGLVIAEAMAAGVPVFGLGGEGEYRNPQYPLVTPENSVFVERAVPGDYGSPEPLPVIEELASRITDFEQRPQEYWPMIERARQWVAARFDGAVQAEAMLQVYEQVLGRPTDAPK